MTKHLRSPKVWIAALTLASIWMTLLGFTGMVMEYYLAVFDAAWAQALACGNLTPC